MRPANPARLRSQVQFLRPQFALGEALPFSKILTEDLVAQTLTEACVSWVDRIFSPLITLWVFLSQVLSADHSCRAAVARLVAHRVARGQQPCSGRTGAYCQARARLPERFYSGVACSQGQLQLNPCAHYYLQEKLFAPAATAAFHDQAIAAGMLLQQ